MNPHIVAMLKRDEGLRLKPYRCTAGKLTIGYGRNLDDVGISDAEAETLLANDIRKVEAEASHYEWFPGLSPARQAVVVSMIFQLGSTGFAAFKNTIRNIAAGDYRAASDGMRQSKWAHQTPLRAGRLARIMETGVM